MRDALIIAAIATPWLIGLGVFLYGCLMLAGGIVVGRLCGFNDRSEEEAE